MHEKLPHKHFIYQIKYIKFLSRRTGVLLSAGVSNYGKPTVHSLTFFTKLSINPSRHQFFHFNIDVPLRWVFRQIMHNRYKSGRVIVMMMAMEIASTMKFNDFFPSTKFSVLTDISEHFNCPNTSSFMQYK